MTDTPIEATPTDTPQVKFTDLNLHPKVQSAIIDAGYETPTPIQAQAIPPALIGKDVLGIAQTGTGKTASFTLPMITMLAKGRAKARMPRSLVLCPTRELAAQVAENFEIYAKNVKLTMALLIGGVSFKDQDKLIDRGVDVLIATPGRLLDHFERGKLLLGDVKIMVVDEADRMLDMGFIPDIERIFKMTPFTRQTLFFSATMAPEIERITNEFLHAPVRIEVARQAMTSATIAQYVHKFHASHKTKAEAEKRETLRALIRAETELTNGIVFCNRKRDVDIVAKSLKKHGMNAGSIHGDMDQAARMRTLEAFKNNELTILVASDVAARGLDIPSVSHVFNFDVPIHAEDYVHRIGRTGRAGRKGRSITICALPRDEKHWDAVEALTKNSVEEIAVVMDNRAPKIERKASSEHSDKPARPAKSRKRRSSSTEDVSQEAKVEAAEPNESPVRDNRPKKNADLAQKKPAQKSNKQHGSAPKGLGDELPNFFQLEFK